MPLFSLWYAWNMFNKCWGLKNHNVYVSFSQCNKINEIPSMSVAASWICLRSPVMQYKWNGTLQPLLQIPSATFTARWVIDQLRDSEALLHVTGRLCEFRLKYSCLSVWSNKVIAQTSPLTREGGAHCDSSGTVTLPGPQRRPTCAWWRAGHGAHVHPRHAFGSLLQDLNARKWQVWVWTRLVSVWLLRQLGLSVWQDLPSSDGWWLENREEKGKWERKLTNCITPWGSVKCPPMKQCEKLRIWQELRELRVIWLQVLDWHSFSSYYLGILPWERALTFKSSRWMTLLKAL